MIPHRASPVAYSHLVGTLAPLAEATGNQAAADSTFEDQQLQEGKMKPFSLVLSAFLLVGSPSFAKGGGHSSGPHYGGGAHSGSHGGTYKGGASGSSHKGGTYKNPNTDDQYGKHK
jgi:hypothetical protein